MSENDTVHKSRRDGRHAGLEIAPLGRRKCFGMVMGNAPHKAAETQVSQRIVHAGDVVSLGVDSLPGFRYRLRRLSARAPPR